MVFCFLFPITLLGLHVVNVSDGPVNVTWLLEVRVIFMGKHHVTLCGASCCMFFVADIIRGWRRKPFMSSFVGHSVGNEKHDESNNKRMCKLHVNI